MQQASYMYMATGVGGSLLGSFVTQTPHDRIGANNSVSLYNNVVNLTSSIEHEDVVGRPLVVTVLVSLVLLIMILTTVAGNCLVVIAVTRYYNNVQSSL